MRYENESDRAKQRKFYTKLVRNYPHITWKQTPQINAESHDVEGFVKGKLVAVCEIKGREYDTGFFEKRGWLLERERLNTLWKQFYRDGVEVFLGLFPTDERCHIVSMRDLLLHRESLDEADASMMKDDHGRKQADKSGLIAPYEILSEI